LSHTEFDTTRAPRAGSAQLTSAIRMLVVLLALAAIVAAIVVSVSQADTPHTTPVVLVNSSGPDTTPTGTGTVASAPTSQDAPVYQGPPPPTWTKVTETAQRAPQTYVLTATPRPPPCPVKLRLCEMERF
jgi:cytoskeletal protein RodZ